MMKEMTLAVEGSNPRRVGFLFMTCMHSLAGFAAYRTGLLSYMFKKEKRTRILVNFNALNFLMNIPDLLP